ncbi:MAG: hypothetical protein J1D87_12385 [Lachnospiraceae bacterium]|nr:hypothetical protein [Lachnospiraceae bacterium]
MKVKNTLATGIETIDWVKVSLDNACKKLLANKSILARILKNCVEEYKDCSLKEIEEKYIEGTPEIARTSVHQDELADRGENVEGIRKGIEKGEVLLSSLMKSLFADGRDEDAMLALEDESMRKKLYKEYGIIDK